MRSPTTITSAYIPITCAPMIGNTTRACARLDDHDARQGHDPDHHREARERGESDGRTPGRRRISRSGAAGSSSRASFVPIMARSAGDRAGPTRRGRVRRHEAGRREPGKTSASASRSFPAKSGLKTAGPRIAPKTAPKRTKEIPARPRRPGTCLPPQSSERERVALAAPTQRGPTRPASKVEGAPAAASTPPTTPRAKPVTRTGTARSGPWRVPRARRRGRRSPTRSPGPGRRALDADDEDDRKRRDRGGELQHRGVRSERGREQDGIPPDRELRLSHRARRSTLSGRPARRRARGGARTRRRARPRRDGRRRSCGDPGRARPGTSGPPSISSPVGRRFVSGSPGRCG